MGKITKALVCSLLATISILSFGECSSRKHIQGEPSNAWVEYVVTAKDFDVILDQIIKSKSDGTAYFSVYFSGNNDSLIIKFVEEPSPSRSRVERIVAEVGLNEYIIHDSLYFLLYPPSEDNMQSVKYLKRTLLRKKISAHMISRNYEGNTFIESPHTTTIIYRKGHFFYPESSAIPKADSASGVK